MIRNVEIICELSRSPFRLVSIMGDEAVMTNNGHKDECMCFEVVEIGPSHSGDGNTYYLTSWFCSLECEITKQAVTA